MPKGQLSLEELHWWALETVNLYSDYVAILYTDGSKLKTSRGVGSAFVCGDTTRIKSLPSCASVFTAELVAIQSALNFIDGSGAPRRMIFSDSLSLTIKRESYHKERDKEQGEQDAHGVLSLLTVDSWCLSYAFLNSLVLLLLMT